jgi:hypothetical protein
MTIGGALILTTMFKVNNVILNAKKNIEDYNNQIPLEVLDPRTLGRKKRLRPQAEIVDAILEGAVLLPKINLDVIK